MSTTAPVFTPETPQAAPAAPVRAAAEERGFSVASFVLGLVSIIAGFTFIVPLAGLGLGIVGLNREPGGRTLAIWGIVLSSVVLAGSVLFGIGAAVLGLAFLPFALFF